MPDLMSLDAAFAEITDYWSPRVIAVANGQYLKIARVKGELVWHAHGEEDEMFMVHRGTFGLKFRDGRDIRLRPGDVFVVPRGVEHFPYAEEETEVIFFEPAATKHTGDVVSEKTRSIEEQVRHLSRPA
jgi:mannose-6-phosphate isomerase-like protein (cupin superfamily)